MIPPIVIVHVGDQSYLDTNLQITSRHGHPMYLLGDRSNVEIARKHSVTHVDVNLLMGSASELAFRKAFVNYSTNSHDFELVCFLRVFWIHQFMIQHGLTSVFHLDSDCVLLRPLSGLLQGNQLAYAVSKNTAEDPFHHCASIHNALINVDFCQAYERLCNDIYVTGDRFHLIQDKIRHHRERRLPGGICDMTLYYLLSEELAVDNLNIPRSGVMFDHCINIPEGFGDQYRFEMYGPLKRIEFDERKRLHAVEAQSKQHYELATLHFQGGAKPLMGALLQHLAD